MRRHIASFILLAVLVGGCTDPGGGNGDGIITDLDLPGAGFNDTGVDGFGDLDLPNLWTHMFGRKQDGDDLDEVHECRDFQRCGVAGVVESLDLLTGENGNFAVVTTGNFRCDTDDFFDEPFCENQEMPVTVSGVETFPALVDTDDGQEWTGAALVFRYALLSARPDPAGSADSVVIRAGPDGGEATVLRLTSGSLGDSLPVRASGCGTQELPDSAGIVTNYPTCSEWQEASADITEFIGQEVRFQFIAGEAGGAIALAFDDVKIELSR
jgi:hypothetical protein